MKKKTIYDVMESVYALQVVRSNNELCFITEKKEAQVKGIDVYQVPQFYFNDEFKDIATTVSVKHMKKGLKYNNIVLEYQEFNSDNLEGTLRDSWFMTDEVDKYAFAMTDCGLQTTKKKKFKKEMYWFVVDAKELKNFVLNQTKYFIQRSAPALERANKEYEGRTYNGNFCYFIPVDFIKENLPQWACQVIPMSKDCFQDALSVKEHNDKGVSYNDRLVKEFFGDL